MCRDPQSRLPLHALASILLGLTVERRVLHTVGVQTETRSVAAAGQVARDHWLTQAPIDGGIGGALTSILYSHSAECCAIRQERHACAGVIVGGVHADLCRCCSLSDFHDLQYNLHASHLG